jgi:hypothetical protein
LTSFCFCVPPCFRYYLATTGNDNFEVNAVTGEVSVSARADLDREANGESYAVVVHAVDGGSVPQTGTATVVVHVEDVNDEPPVFGRRAYGEFVSEATAVGTEMPTRWAKSI